MKTLTDKNFEETISNATKPVIIDFWAEWCPPCKKLTPVLEKIAETYKNKVDIYKVNVDQNPFLSQTFSIEVIPTVIFFKGNDAKSGFVGFREEEEIKKWIDNNI
ncbi:MAG: thioredoxin [Candidatus Pacebacteria bacterium]|jgi:thioredoxin 1|nr:thioredoxin [Candidatus Paceibacterota bacterium]NMB47510.1 thioredoxin [Patescibacteria group bacterium]MDD2796549.1 thioredoxin [Candidatus Paceibacterota bacterium]MDD3047794.1 thioredoxin [Candidatus Paceibacterota bacterium]MDD3509720.1 thioredoxin [Candidatus Paceibacterota bacterium]